MGIVRCFFVQSYTLSIRILNAICNFKHRDLMFYFCRMIHFVHVWFAIEWNEKLETVRKNYICLGGMLNSDCKFFFHRNSTSSWKWVPICRWPDLAVRLLVDSKWNGMICISFKAFITSCSSSIIAFECAQMVFLLSIQSSM